MTLAERWPGQTPEGVQALCADQSFGQAIARLLICIQATLKINLTA